MIIRRKVKRKQFCFYRHQSILDFGIQHLGPKTMLVFCHIIIWARMVTEIYGYNLGNDKLNDELCECALQGPQNSNSSNANYEKDVTSYTKSHSQDSRHIKYNYFFHDTQPARPPGCPPCCKFMPLLSIGWPS